MIVAPCFELLDNSPILNSWHLRIAWIQNFQILIPIRIPLAAVLVLIFGEECLNPLDCAAEALGGRRIAVELPTAPVRKHALAGRRSVVQGLRSLRQRHRPRPLDTIVDGVMQDGAMR